MERRIFIKLINLVEIMMLAIGSRVRHASRLSRLNNANIEQTTCVNIIRQIRKHDLRAQIKY